MDFEPERFRVGGAYRTQHGKWVRFVSVHNADGPYETMADQHGVHRYTTRDFGRVTGSPHDYSDPRNTPPRYVPRVPRKETTHDETITPHPRWSPGDKSDRHPQFPIEWDWRADPCGAALDCSIRRLNVAMDYDDPRAPDQMALVLRIDLSRLMADRTHKHAAWECFRGYAGIADRAAPAIAKDMAALFKEVCDHFYPDRPVTAIEVKRLEKKITIMAAKHMRDAVKSGD